MGDVDSINTKTISDLNTIASALEINTTKTGKTLEKYVDNSIPIKTNGGTLYTGLVNYSELGLKGKDFFAYSGGPYEIRTFSIIIDNLSNSLISH